jgi:bifunctional UDP-N-acetylglucosamine pyrophosphorylase/glucosamine-1-phosphate N-acetyltransferase
VVLKDLMEVSGVNSRSSLRIGRHYVDRIRKHWLNNGVVIHNPSSVYIGDEVQIEPDVEIHRDGDKRQEQPRKRLHYRAELLSGS